MKYTKQIGITTLAVLALVALSFGSSIAAEKYDGPPVTLNWSNYYPETSHIAQTALKPYIQYITKESGGRILFKEYWAGQLHGVNAGFDACKSGMTDITQAYVLLHSNRFDLFNVGEMPFAFRDPLVGAMVMEELYPKYFKKEYEKQGVYLASYPAINQGAGIISKKPVRKLEDLKGLKVLTGGGIISESFKMLGVRPVAVAPSELFSSLQTGIIDAVCTGKGMVIPRQFQEVAKYYIELDVSMIGIAYCMNKKTFDGLQPPLKKQLYGLLREANYIMTRKYLTLDDDADQELRKAGVEIIRLPAEDYARAKTMMNPIWDEFVAQKEKKRLPAKQMVTDLRALSQKYGAMSFDDLWKEVKSTPVKGIIDGM